MRLVRPHGEYGGSYPPAWGVGAPRPPPRRRGSFCVSAYRPNPFRSGWTMGRAYPPGVRSLSACAPVRGWGDFHIVPEAALGRYMEGDQPALPLRGLPVASRRPSMGRTRIRGSARRAVRLSGALWHQSARLGVGECQRPRAADKGSPLIIAARRRSASAVDRRNPSGRADRHGSCHRHRPPSLPPLPADAVASGCRASTPRAAAAVEGNTSSSIRSISRTRPASRHRTAPASVFA